MIDPAYLAIHQAWIAVYPEEIERIVCPVAWYALLRTIKDPQGIYLFQPTHQGGLNGIVGHVFGWPVILRETASQLPELATATGQRTPIPVDHSGPVKHPGPVKERAL